MAVKYKMLICNYKNKSHLIVLKFSTNKQSKLYKYSQAVNKKIQNIVHHSYHYLNRYMTTLTDFLTSP